MRKVSAHLGPLKNAIIRTKPAPTNPGISYNTYQNSLRTIITNYNIEYRRFEVAEESTTLVFRGLLSSSVYAQYRCRSGPEMVSSVTPRRSPAAPYGRSTWRCRPGIFRPRSTADSAAQLDSDGKQASIRASQDECDACS